MRSFLVAVLMLFSLLLSARAQQDADEKYIAIYGVVQQAENLAGTGGAAPGAGQADGGAGAIAAVSKTLSGLESGDHQLPAGRSDQKNCRAEGAVGGGEQIGR